MTQGQRLNILIVGGGIGGTVAAYWLARAGHRVTVVERYPALRAGGTQVDLRHQGAEIAKRMGLMNSIRPFLVEETGFSIVDTTNNVIVKHETGADNFLTQEIEILRGDLLRVLYDHTKNSVSYIFGKTVESFQQDDKGVTVAFSDNSKETYDVLVGADGLGSRVRRGIHPSDSDPIKSLNMACAFWFLPRSETDSTVARMCYASGGRFLMLRTANSTVTQALIGIKGDGKELGSLLRVPEEQQKDYWINRYRGSRWEENRLLSSLKNGEATGFYSTEIAQVKTPIWHKGRVVLIADAAHCPSPMTGMGTTSAFVGAFVLAGEIATHPDDLERAFRNYDEKLRPFAEKIQELPGIMELLMPQTELGIRALHLVLKIMHWVYVLFVALRLDLLYKQLSPQPKKGWELPVYPALA